MKISFGFLKGQKIKTIDEKQLRPTTSLIKEAVFNSLQFEEFEKISFLDLFSGTGIMGIEALSLGCENVTFIDINRKLTDLLKTNLKKLNLLTFSTIITDKIPKILSKLEKKFDIIYIDPPYIFYEKFEENILPIFDEIANNNLLNENGLLFLEAPVSYKKDTSIKNFYLEKKKKYSSTFLYKFTLE